MFIVVYILRSEVIECIYSKLYYKIEVSKKEKKLYDIKIIGNERGNKSE